MDNETKEKKKDVENATDEGTQPQSKMLGTGMARRARDKLTNAQQQEQKRLSDIMRQINGR